MIKGKSFLLKIGNGEQPPAYETVAGLRVTEMSINGDIIVEGEASSWRELVSGSGNRSVSIGASGIFLGSNAEALIRGRTLSGMVNDYQLSFDDGEKLRGRFLVQRLDYTGDFNRERNYSIRLESSGPVRKVK